MLSCLIYCICKGMLVILPNMGLYQQSLKSCVAHSNSQAQWAMSEPQGSDLGESWEHSALSRAECTKLAAGAGASSWKHTAFSPLPSLTPDASFNGLLSPHGYPQSSLQSKLLPWQILMHWQVGNVWCLRQIKKCSTQNLQQYTVTFFPLSSYGNLLLRK